MTNPHFVNQMSKKIGKQIKKITGNAMECLIEYPWPGNVRQLKHIIERALLSCKGDRLKLSDLNLSKTVLEPSQTDDNIMPLKEMERHHITKALERCDWKVSGKKQGGQTFGGELKYPYYKNKPPWY